MGGDRIACAIEDAGFVSIHAPAWGATPPGMWRSSHFARFQSTPPRGGRRASIANGGHQRVVSIHAPAWGATLAVIPDHRLLSGFNPRPRVGGDGSSSGLPGHQPGFNPRPRVGGD
ncbi:hypothetical protein MTBSS4_170025 [Magnetospirillum sp. SS-4]|nr:hypothetical protein MTBSS4_170025 [Magnetospirillum sp. SS-4]